MKKTNRENVSATSFNRFSSMIAANKRRKCGKRSIALGMFRPPKFLMACLNEIESSLGKNVIYNDDGPEKSLVTSSWGLEFWECFLSGKDILETSGRSSTLEQIAWIVSTAADAMTRRDKDSQDDLSGYKPFLLFLVPSTSKVFEVLSVCQALKDVGIHTVSLHAQESQDHDDQINGLKSCEPEFLVCTPDKLLKIVELRGIDISGVSLLVIDELGSLCNDNHLDALKSIKQAISSKHQSIVFNDDSFSVSNISAVQSLLVGSIRRVALSEYVGIVASQGCCITQTVHFCASEKEQQEKFVELLHSSSSKIICIVTKKKRFPELKAALLESKSPSASANSDSKISDPKKSPEPLVRWVDVNKFNPRAMRDSETVLLLGFAPLAATYTKILTNMARKSIHGVLHNILTEQEAAEAEAATSLTFVLEECGQNIPERWVAYGTVSD